jgi:hypothetical protein
MRAAWGMVLVTVALGCEPGHLPESPTTQRYDMTDTALVMKAVMNALQDEGFIIHSSNTELGEISASKEKSNDHWVFIFVARRVESWECSVNVSAFGQQTKVRVNLQRSETDALRNVLDVHAVDDPNYYSDLFSKVDKSLFIQKERL